MFDRYVAQQKPKWRRRALIIASVALHVIAAIVLLIWSIFHVDEIAPPALSLTFFSAPPPPPPPPPPPAKKKSTNTEVHKVEEHKMVQPTDVPKIIQPKEEKPPEKDEDDGEEGGVEGGEKGGVKGGVVGGVKGGVVGGTVGGTGTDLNAKGPAPRTVAGFTLIKDQLSHPDPHLPDAVYARFHGQRVQGTYKVCLRPDGHVSDVTPVASILGADDQIISQIRSGWTYKPQPVPVCFVAIVKYEVK